MRRNDMKWEAVSAVLFLFRRRHVMVLQREIESVKMLFKPHKDAEKIERPPLVLQAGSQLDPGIRLKDKPNEDSLFVEHGIVNSPTGLSQPYDLFVVADGMGGQ